MDSFIVCENLVKIYKVAELEVVALQGLDLTVQPGELLGIVGTSGSGKSTLLNVLGGLDRPSAGRVTVGDKDLLKLSDTALDAYRRREVGFIWQQTARNLIPYLSAQENVKLPMTIAGMSLRQKRNWAQELLEAVGLWDHRQHRLAQLSGGQQQRVAIAVALANKPSLLLGDEPTGELDSRTAQEILSLFQRLNRQYGLTTIIVTHDPQVARTVDRVVTIRDGRTSSETVRRVSEVEAALTQGMEQSPKTAVFEEYVVVDGAGRLQIPPDLREETGIGNRVTLEATEDGILIRPVASQNGDQPAETKTLAQEPPPTKPGGLRRWFRREGSTEQVHNLFKMNSSEKDPIIEARGVSRIYHLGGREVPALQKVNLTVSPGQLVALRGRSGSGKTTLLNCIGGLDQPTEGEVRVEGQHVTRMPESQRVSLRRRRIGFVFQSHALMPTYSARENVDLMLRLAGSGRRARLARTEEVLKLVGLGKWMDHRPYELSGGQQQRVAIARAIAPRPAIILADEPTGELDTATGQQILQLFRHIADRESTTVVIATHDLAVDAFADAVYHLQDGRILP